MRDKAKSKAQLIAELSALRQQVAELEARVGDCQQTQERLSNIAANLPGAVYEFVFHPDGRIALPYISAGTYQISGLEPPEAMAHPERLLERIHPDDRLTPERFAQVYRDPTLPFIYESRIMSLSGHTKWVRDIARVTIQENGTIIFHGIALDITEHKILTETQQRYEFIVNTSKEFMTLINREHVYEAANKAYCQAHLKTPAEIIGRTVAEIWGEERYSSQIKPYLDACFAGQEMSYQGWFEFAALGRRYFNVTYYPYFDPKGNVSHSVVVSHDVTNGKQVEAQLQASLQEKEILLQEIHHRVKNNLQIITSLLDFQTEFIQDKQAITAFSDSQSRIKSIALVHELLYNSENLAQIDLSQYMRNLVDDLLHTYGEQTTAVTTQIEVDAGPEGLWLDINTAIPCGLIINELVSNALKHAFVGRQTGSISLKAQWLGDNLVLQVRDDGIGLPESLDFRQTTSLGLQLVNMLTQQLKGQLQWERQNGATFTLSFTRPK
ncbi:MAG: hypothetical protein Fur0044_04640 [Anaerolineae bacterium]|nr:PAS domain S-box protein [Anaerolineales bacterium]